MRPTLSLLVVTILVVLFSFSLPQDSSAWDYNARFIRNYPPGFYGMWYKAERFFETRTGESVPDELYRWDRYMSRVTGVTYPFLPIPYAWDYGSSRKFNLPDYNTNDWW
ncbi:MAG: hypothetical protein P8182_02525 [Deltaproteobacteria bacterium]